MHRVLPVVLLLLAGCLGTGGNGVDDASGAGDSDDAGPGGADPADGSTDPGDDAGSGTGGETDGNGTDPEGGAAGSGTDGETTGNGTDPDGPGAYNGTSDTSTQTSSSGTETSSSNSTDTGTSDPGTRLLEVSAWDVTIYTPPQGTEIEVVPNGTWSPVFSYGSDGPHPMGHHPVSVLHEDVFIVRPDGPGGTQCVTDFMVTEAMEDYTAEAINHVEIYDAEVWIYGPAIPGHPDDETAYICAR